MDSSPFSQTPNRGNSQVIGNPLFGSPAAQGQRAPANRTLFANQRVVGGSSIPQFSFGPRGSHNWWNQQNNVRQTAAEPGYNFDAPPASSPAHSQQPRVTTVYPVGVKAGMPTHLNAHILHEGEGLTNSKDRFIKWGTEVRIEFSTLWALNSTGGARTREDPIRKRDSNARSESRRAGETGRCKILSGGIFGNLGS